jgi:putative transposase
VPDLSRRYGIAENTIYRWKSKFGGMEVSDAKRLLALEAENRKLKRLLGEAELDKAAMKEIIEGNGNGQAQASRCGTLDGTTDQRTTRLPPGRYLANGDVEAAQGPERYRASRTPEAVGRTLPAIRVSDAARHAAGRRVGPELEANVPDLPGRRPPGSPQASQKAYPAADPDGHTDTRQRALVGGFHV